MYNKHAHMIKYPPYKLTPEVQEKVSEQIRQGQRVSTACRIAGISYESFCSWMDSAEVQGEGSPTWGFYEAVKKAEAENEAENVDHFQRIVKTSTDFRAPMAFLERRHGWMPPGMKLEIDVTQAKHSNIGVDLGKLTIEEKRQYIALLERMAEPKQIEGGSEVIDVSPEPVVEVETTDKADDPPIDYSRFGF